MSRAALDQAQAQALADGGVEWVLAHLGNPALKGGLLLKGQLNRVRIGEDTVTITVQDEAGKIDINFIPPSVFETLLINTGVAKARAAVMASALERQRAPFMEHDQGKGDAKTELAFKTLADIKTLPGMNEDLFLKLRPLLTVYSGLVSPQVDSAPRDVLLAMPNMTPESVDALIADRSGFSRNATMARSWSTRLRGPSGLAGKALCVLSQAEKGRARVVRRAIIKPSIDSSIPTSILEWGVEEAIYRRSQIEDKH